jgi:Cytochrome c7 and related cytochrome c
MLAPVAASLREDRPLNWIRVHRVPDFVYFNHSIHVNKGIGCSTCHGRVDQMPLMWRTQSLQMSWCLGCHRAPENYLRPHAEVFDMTWQPPADQLQQGRALLAAYKIDRHRLTDCSNCHR